MEKPTVKCPYAGFKRCMGHGCALYVQIRGYDINTGKEVDRWDCAQALLPMLLIENSGQQRQTGAAVESFRNESVRTSDNLVRAISAVIAVQENRNARLNHQN